jgi:hypothetical protein
LWKFTTELFPLDWLLIFRKWHFGGELFSSKVSF